MFNMLGENSSVLFLSEISLLDSVQLTGKASLLGIYCFTDCQDLTNVLALKCI